MAEGEKYNPKGTVTPPEDFTALDEILAKGIAEKVFEERIAKIQENIKNQEKISWGIVVGVAIAFIFAIGVIVSEHINSRDLHSEKFDSIDREIHDQAIIISNIKNHIENTKKESEATIKNNTIQ